MLQSEIIAENNGRISAQESISSIPIGSPEVIVKIPTAANIIDGKINDPMVDRIPPVLPPKDIVDTPTGLDISKRNGILFIVGAALIIIIAGYLFFRRK